MSALILGLLLFLGMHSSRIVAEGWRSQVIATKGPGAWKGLYTVVSLVGLGLIVWGYGQARLTPTILWQSPVWTRHLAALLVLVALVLIAASQVPGNSIKARLHHPMVLGVKVWALAHLLANNTVADALLFLSPEAKAAARKLPAGSIAPMIHGMPAQVTLGPKMVASTANAMPIMPYKLPRKAVSWFDNPPRLRMKRMVAPM